MELIRPRDWALLAPLRHRGFRRFFTGQLLSTIGTQIQAVGQAWLVLELTRSPFLLGVISALQWSPALVLSSVGGLMQLHLGAAGFGALMSAQGAGALAGALGVAAMGRRPHRRRFLLWTAIVLCGATMALGLARVAAAAGGLLVAAGASMIAFAAVANSTVQLETPDALRGRVMSLYNLVYNGTTPPGALLIGWLIERAGLPVAMEITGAVGLVGAVGLYAVLPWRTRPRTA